MSKRKLTDIFPSAFSAGGGGGYLNPSTIERVAPVYTPPVPSFSVTVTDTSSNTLTAYSTTAPCGTAPNVISFRPTWQPFICVNITDDTTYNRLEWSVRNMDTDTFLPSGAGQTYTIPANTSTGLVAVTYEIELRAFIGNDLAGAYGEACLRLVDYNLNDYDLINSTAHFNWSVQNQSPVFPITTLTKQYVTDNTTWLFLVDHDANSDPDLLSVSEIHTSSGGNAFALISTSPTSWQFSFDFTIDNYPASTDFFIKTTALYSSGPSPVYRYLRYQFNIPDPPDALAAIRFNGLNLTATGLNTVLTSSRIGGSPQSVFATDASTGYYHHWSLVLLDPFGIIVPGFDGQSVTGSFYVTFTEGVNPYKYVLILYNLSNIELSRAEVTFNMLVILPAITFKNVKTKFLTQQTPESFVSTTNSTSLTFTNSTQLSSIWDNSLMSITVT